MEIKIRGYTNGDPTLYFVIELPPEIAAAFTPRVSIAGNTQPQDIMNGYLDWLEEKNRRKQDDEE